MQLSKQKNKITWALGIRIALLLFIAVYLTLQVNQALGIFLFIGTGLGYIENRSKIGIISGYTDFFLKGSRTRLYGLLILFGLGVLVALLVHFNAAQNGALPANQVNNGSLVIPGTEAVVPVDFGLVLGSFLFGMGLTMNEGCGLGTIRNIGQGKFRYLWPLGFILIGTIPGHFVKYQLDQSAIHDYSFELYLPDAFGYFGTLLLFAGLFGFLVYLAKRYERYRRENNLYVDTDAMNLPEEEGLSDATHSTMYWLFKKEWPRIVSIFLITALLLLSLAFTGEKLTVTQPLLYPAVWLFEWLGFSFEHPAFQEPLAIVQNGLLNHTKTLNNVGILIGAVIYSLTSTTFTNSFSMQWKQAGWSALSGLFMGFGAVLASGCIVGALYSGIVNLSISGWVVFSSMSFGIYVTVKALNGRVSAIPEI